MIYGKSIVNIDDEESQTKETTAVIYADFANLHEPQCKGIDAADTPASDFETWTPYDGRHGDTKCFLG